MRHVPATLVLALAALTGCNSSPNGSMSLSEVDDLEIDGINPATIESVDKSEKWAAATRGLVFENGRVSADPRYLPSRDEQMSSNRIVLGREAMDQNLRDAAIVHTATAVRLDPGNPEAYYWLGRAVTLRGKVEEAAACFRTALDQRPAWTDAQFELGMSQWRAGRLDQAEREFNDILSREPAHGPSLERMAVAAYYAGDLAAAGRYARAAEAAGQPVPSQLWELLRN